MKKENILFHEDTIKLLNITRIILLIFSIAFTFNIVVIIFREVLKFEFFVQFFKPFSEIILNMILFFVAIILLTILVVKTKKQMSSITITNSQIELILNKNKRIYETKQIKTYVISKQRFRRRKFKLTMDNETEITIITNKWRILSQILDILIKKNELEP